MLALAALLLFAGAFLAMASGVSIADASAAGTAAPLVIRVSAAFGFAGMLLFFAGSILCARMLV